MSEEKETTVTLTERELREMCWEPDGYQVSARDVRARVASLAERAKERDSQRGVPDIVSGKVRQEKTRK